MVKYTVTWEEKKTVDASSKGEAVSKALRHTDRTKEAVVEIWKQLE